MTKGDAFYEELIKVMTAPISSTPTPPGDPMVMPPHDGSRVLVAFLDKNDEPTWSYILPCTNIDIRFEPGEPCPRMSMDFYMSPQAPR